MPIEMWLLIVVFVFYAVFQIIFFRKVLPRILKLEEEKIERIKFLTDPEQIDAELERSARRREAFDSKMPYPPREDSGPSATVRTPARAPSYRSNGLSFRKRQPWANRPSAMEGEAPKNG